MKPRKLILCGWGPYKNKQEIDFEQLDGRGLFLITGPTGAGKTTLFDAITYALYGNMSGQIREKSSVRSDFAQEDIPTYVELSMTHGGEYYSIYRNPEYLRPKKRKAGDSLMTKEKERAVLTLPDGSKIEGAGEVSSKIQEILRLNYKQFKQLSLIAQGEFAKLMTASSSEKSRILREIFDTELFDNVAGILRKRSSSLLGQVKEYRHKMEEDVAFFMPMEDDVAEWQTLTEGDGLYFDEIIDFLQNLETEQSNSLKKCETEYKKVQQEADLLAAKVAEAEKIKSLFEKRDIERQKKETIQMQMPVMMEHEEKLRRAREALLVKSYEQAWQYAVEKETRLFQKNTSLEEEVKNLQKKQKEEADFVSNWNRIELAYEQRQQEKQLWEKQELLQGNLEGQQKILRDLQEEYLMAEKDETAAKSDYEAADRQYRHAMAGILASELQENIPCPVCGSLHHPQKAVLSKDMPTAQTVKEKKQRFEEKQQISLTLHGKTAACKERTEGIVDSIRNLQQERELVLGEIGKQTAFVKTYTENVSFAEFTKQRKENEALQIRLKEREMLLEAGKKELQQQIGHTKEAKNIFSAKRKESGFETQETYRKAFLPEAEIEKINRIITAYREERHANEQMLIHLETELSGKEPADINTLQKELAKAKGEREESGKQLEAKKHYVQNIRRLFDALRRKNEKKQKLEEEYGIVKRLDDAASGNNRLRLVFEQYVLAAYFEEILKAANIRLQMMSSGRYELCRSETLGDGRKKDNLEMDVMDYYTGKYRSVKTLSGGESFKTSLALALGMSDVVQALSGGIRVETLFIDEGFGSLDSESLEQASATLQSLVERDRLIGIISHVPELAEKIANKIRIHKTNAGSRAEIVIS